MTRPMRSLCKKLTQHAVSRFFAGNSARRRYGDRLRSRKNACARARCPPVTAPVISCRLLFSVE